MRKLRRFFIFIAKIAGVLLLIGGLFLGYKNYTALKKVYSYEETIAEQTEKYGISDYQE